MGFRIDMQTTTNIWRERIHLAPVIINLVMFQSVWIVTVMSVTLDLVWPGPAAICVFFIVHGLISTTARADFMLAGIAVFSGLVIDSLLIQTGLIEFHMNLPWPGVAPFWILILWANFALILNHGLGWLQGRYKTAAILGFFGGPLSYLAGVGLGSGDLLVSPAVAFPVIGSCWAIVTPLLLFAARKLPHPSRTP
jgi:hypothetical protein